MNRVEEELKDVTIELRSGWSTPVVFGLALSALLAILGMGQMGTSPPSSSGRTVALVLIVAGIAGAQGLIKGVPILLGKDHVRSIDCSGVRLNNGRRLFWHNFRRIYIASEQKTFYTEFTIEFRGAAATLIPAAADDEIAVRSLIQTLERIQTEHAGVRSSIEGDDRRRAERHSPLKEEPVREIPPERSGAAMVGAAVLFFLAVLFLATVVHHPKPGLLTISCILFAAILIARIHAGVRLPLLAFAAALYAEAVQSSTSRSCWRAVGWRWSCVAPSTGLARWSGRSGPRSPGEPPAPAWHWRSPW
jgi:hypothetical protein